MAKRGENQFTPKLGRIRYQSGGRRARTYLSKVQRSISRAGGSIGNSPRRAPRTSGYAGRRRVIVKARVVRMTSSSKAALAKHLRYISRESATQEQDKGKVFDTLSDDVDLDLFAEDASEDRHHFRFIVSPEDGAQIEDLKPVVRELINAMEHDLGTRLDWVGAVHTNTGHPHAHIVVRGRRDDGQDLVIPRNYISHGIRERATDLVTLELGPETMLERDEKLMREVNAERLTRTDRTLLRMADERGHVDLSFSASQYRSHNTARLQTLERMRLAQRTGPNTWSLDPQLQPKLKTLGERGDIIKALNKASAGRSGRVLDADHSLSRHQDLEKTLTGALIETGVSGDFHDQRYAIIDTLDGRIVRIAIEPDGPTHLKPGTIVALTTEDTSPKPSDKTVHDIAQNHKGFYSPALHQRDDPRATPGYIEAHVRRLESLRRSSGIVERHKDGTWRIPDDHLAKVETVQRKRAMSRPRKVEILSAVPIQEQITEHGLTWLDSTDTLARGIKGFGADAASAKTLRQKELVDRRILQTTQQRLTLQQAETLRQAGLVKAGANLAEKLGKEYQPAPTQGQVSGKFSQHVDLADGRYAVLEREHKFSLVRWRQIMERGRGQSITGRVSGNKISWKFGVQRGRGLSR